MKIWLGYGSEHSSNLVIVGKFKTAIDAREALSLLERTTDMVRSAEGRGEISSDKPPEKFPNAILDFLSKENFMELASKDLPDFMYEFDPKIDGDSVVITTDEYSIGGFLSTLLHKGAKIEVYSAH